MNKDLVGVSGQQPIIKASRSSSVSGTAGGKHGHARTGSIDSKKRVHFESERGSPKKEKSKERKKSQVNLGKAQKLLA